MAKKNAIVKNGVNKNDVVMTIPDDYSMEIDRSDIKIPSILLWQKMSDMPEFEGENVRAGMFVNPVTGDIYDGAFEGAIIRYYTTARIWGAKDKDGRKLFCSVDRFLTQSQGERVMRFRYEAKVYELDESR